MVHQMAGHYNCQKQLVQLSNIITDVFVLLKKENKDGKIEQNVQCLSLIGEHIGELVCVLFFTTQCTTQYKIIGLIM